jgi:hypothetical protein
MIQFQLKTETEPRYAGECEREAHGVLFLGLDNGPAAGFGEFVPKTMFVPYENLAYASDGSIR